MGLVRSLRAGLVIDEAPVVVPEGHQPARLGDRLDAVDRLTREGVTEIDLAPAEANAAAARHCDCAIVEGISEIR